MSDTGGWIDPDPVFSMMLVAPGHAVPVCTQGPEHWIGHRPVLLLDLDYCNEPHPWQDAACGLVRGHTGPHLRVAIGLLTGIGPVGIEAIR